MFHLIEDNVSKIENSLLGAKHFAQSIFSQWFNVIILILVVCSFGYFLWSKKDTEPKQELTKIPFEPRTWNNAVKNVPIVDYGQTPQIEIGHGIQGYSLKGSEATF
jgi:hypothetical protein